MSGLAGRVLGEFVVREPIGEGGFAVLYRAEQPALGRDAVVKVLRQELAARPEVAARFLREARLASRIDHPYAAHVYAFGEESDGVVWIAMELVRGTAMDALLAARGALPPSALVPLFERICDVVQHAHDLGVVHRDLKPGNVMVLERGGRLLPKLLDFGIARALDAVEDEGAPAAAGPVALAVTAPWVEARAGATRPGQVMGSPAYMAPEQWVDAAAVGPASDVYALGVLGYQALTGTLPFEEATLEGVRRAHLERPPPPLGEGFAPSLDAVIARALAKRAEDRWPSAAALAAALRDAVEERAPRADDDGGPYRGLAAFTSADAAEYVGREREVVGVVDRLIGESVVAVVGASGAGKSSFVQAGVVPHLPEGWRAIVVRPGGAPRAALRAHLAAAGIDAIEPGALRAAAAREGGALVIVVDQLEELFTLCPDDGERAAYAAALADATPTDVDPVRLIVTLRDDFLMRAVELPGLGPRLARGLHLLTTPSAADLERIVEEPARRAGFALDEGLAATMVKEVAGQPGALALLSFTAAALWERRDRDRRLLTRKAHDALGGVGGALAKHAEAVLAALAPDDQRLVRVAFRNLVTVEGTRQTLSRDELVQVLGERARAGAVIDKLVDARLLVTSEDAGGATRIEVIHEALLTAWPRLVTWRREDAEGARLRDQLRTAARQWDDRGRPRGLLWRDDALAEYQRWRARHPQALTDLESTFGAASIAAESRGRRVRRALVLAAFAILAAGALVLYRSRSQTADQRALAVQRADEIQRRLIESDTARAQQALLAEDFPTARDLLGRLIASGTRTGPVRFMMARATDPFVARVATSAAEAGIPDEVRYSPDGSRFVVVGEFGSTLCGADGRVLVRFAGMTMGSVHVAWRPDGEQLAILDGAGRLRLFSKDGVLVATGAGSNHAQALPGRLSYRPDGARLVSSFEREVTIWDATTAALVTSWSADPNGLTRAIYDVGGERIITAGLSGLARVWSPDGSLLLELRGHVGSVTHVVSSGERIITTGADMTARIWDRHTGAALQVLHSNDGRLSVLAIDPTGQYVLTAGGEATPRIWRIETGAQLAMLRGHTGVVMQAMWPRVDEVITVGRDGTIRTWDPLREVTTTVLWQGGQITGFDVAPGGDRLAAGSSHATTVWDLTRTARIASMTDAVAVAMHPAPPPVVAGHSLVRWSGRGVAGWDLDAPGRHWVRVLDATAVSLTADGGTAIVGDLHGTIHLLDAATGVTTRTFTARGGAVRALAVLPDGNLAVASADSLATWNLVAGTPLRQQAIGAIDSLAVSATGALFGYLVSGDDETGRVAWWADADLAGVHRIDLPSAVIAARFSPSGSWLAVTCWATDAQLWDRDRQLVRTLPGTSRAQALVWRPDERVLVTDDGEGTVVAWNPHTGERAVGSENHTTMTALAFDPTGSVFASSGGDRTVRVWGLAPLRLLYRIETGREFVSDVRFVGDRLLTSSATYTDVWRADMVAP